ncbi:MAG: cobalamin-binding protein [Firmicutes bacterium]|nr:cobalamin-binding protein [Bacillota bacterium]
MDKFRSMDGSEAIIDRPFIRIVFQHGTPDEVEEAAKRAMDAAAEGGGFVLSTGDQCGRDTPEENIFRLVEVARDYGRY